MEVKEVIELNRLIAEFMDVAAEDIKSDRAMYYEYSYPDKWDFLMSVVDRIESLGWTVLIEKGLCHIFSDKYPAIEVDFANKDNTEKTPKIQLCFMTVVEFIKWHNTNLSK